MFYIKALQDISKLRFNIGITDEANLKPLRFTTLTAMGVITTATRHAAV